MDGAAPVAVFEFGHRVINGRTHATVTQQGKPGERSIPATDVTKQWAEDSALRILITLAYGGA
jgi:hypothetical protein